MTVRYRSTFEPTETGSVKKTKAVTAGSMRDLFGVTTWAVRGALVLYLGVFITLAVGSMGPEASVLIEVFTLVCVSAAAVFITRTGPSPFRGRATITVLLLLLAAAVARFFQVFPEAESPFAHWHVAAITFVLIGLILRGRACWAWAYFVVLAALSVVWALNADLGAGTGIGLVIRHAGTLFLSNLMAIGIHRSGLALAAFNAQRAEDEAAEMSRFSTLDERRAQLNRVNAMSRPVLEQFAAAAESLGHVPTAAAFSPALLAEGRLVEASLRDAMRGRALFREPVIEAARQARMRGVEVILLDDSGDDSPAQIDSLACIVAGELSILQRGRLTARIWPAGRDTVASIVIEAMVPGSSEADAAHLAPGQPRSRMITVDVGGTSHEAAPL